MLAYAHEESLSPDSLRCSRPLTGSGHTHGQSRVPRSIRCHGGRGASRFVNYVHRSPGSSQLVHFSNDKLTIAAKIEVEDIRDGVALVRVRAKSYPGRVDRETPSEN